MKDTFLTSLGALGSGIVTALLGGWDSAMEILLIIIVLDYLTGVAAAFKNKELKSSVGYNGLIKKVMIFFALILAAQLDRMTGNAAGVFRTATAFFFTANEGLSVIENVGELGVKLPGFIADTLINLRENKAVSNDTKENK